MLVLQPVAGKPLGEQSGQKSLFLCAQAEYLALQPLHGRTFAHKIEHADIGGGAAVAGVVVKLPGSMKGHLSASEQKTLFLGGAKQFALIDIDQLPIIMPFPFVAEVAGQLHIKHRDQSGHMKQPFKANACRIVFHQKSPLADFYSIITDFILSCKDGINIIKVVNQIIRRA